MDRYVIKSMAGYMVHVRANSCAWNPKQSRAARYSTMFSARETMRQVYVELNKVSDRRGMRAMKIRIVRLVSRKGTHVPTCFAKGDSLDGDDVCFCRGDDATPDDACVCVTDPGEVVKSGEHPICIHCGAEVYDHAPKGGPHG